MDGDGDGLRFGRPSPERSDATTTRRKLGGVAEEIEQDLLHLVAVRMHHRRFGAEQMRYVERERLAQHLRQHQRPDVVQHALHVEVRDGQGHAARLDFGEVEDRVNEAQQQFLRALDAPEGLGLSRASSGP